MSEFVNPILAKDFWKRRKEFRMRKYIFRYRFWIWKHRLYDLSRMYHKYA